MQPGWCDAAARQRPGTVHSAEEKARAGDGAELHMSAENRKKLRGARSVGRREIGRGQVS